MFGLQANMQGAPKTVKVQFHCIQIQFIITVLRNLYKLLI